MTFTPEHSGSVPESPTFFSASSFKVLSPQPPKFLKSLLPVKEENKTKKVLEARPLLGQEVQSTGLNQLSVLCPQFHKTSPQAHKSLVCQSAVIPNFYHLAYEVAFQKHHNILTLVENIPFPKVA